MRDVLDKLQQMGRSCTPRALNVAWTPSMWWRHSSWTGKAAQALRDFEQLAWQFAPYCIYKHFGNLNSFPWCFQSSHPQQNRHAGRSCTTLPHLCDNLLKIQKKGARFNLCRITHVSSWSASYMVFEFPLRLCIWSPKPELPQRAVVRGNPRTDGASSTSHVCHCLSGVAGTREEPAALTGTSEHGAFPGRCRTRTSPCWQNRNNTLRCPPLTAEKSMGFLSGATQKQGQRDAPAVLITEIWQGWSSFSDVSQSSSKLRGAPYLLMQKVSFQGTSIALLTTGWHTATEPQIHS